MSDDTTPDTPTPDADVITDEVVADVEDAHEELADEAEADAEADVEPEPEPDPNAVTLNVNGRDVPARKGDMVISAALLADEYVPHFCYHPRMSPVGMCRQCMVEVEGPPRSDDGGVVHDAGRRRPGRSHRHPAGQARPGGHARIAARQPSARLPCLRQGRRMPAAGPGVQPRAGRVAVRRREAPLRKADPDQRPGLPRP